MTSKLIFPSRVPALTKLNQMLKTEAYKDAKLFILLDENSYNNCLPTLINHVSTLENAEFFEVPVGEEAKSIEIATQLWNSLLDSNADRQCVIINLGGGCVSDLGGFVAAGYKRGIRYINIPTTLIGMVDAAIGGKTALNLENSKNQVGFFWQPEAVCIHPDFLDTLADQEIINGLFEVIKTLYLSDGPLLNQLMTKLINKPEDALQSIKTMIPHCATFKSRVVKADPNEESVRKILNFGHTFGHGIESFAMEKSLPIKHGIAVGIGMACALYLSVKKLGLNEKVLNDYCSFLFSTIDVPHFSLADTESILKYMRHDKKNRDNLILCVLLQELSLPVIDVAISENEIRDTLLHINIIRSSLA